MRRPPTATLVALVLGAAALTGCGNDRTAPPDVTTPGPPLGANRERLDAAGVSLLVPRGWRYDTAVPAPLVATISEGRATVALYRFPRTEPLPDSAAELDAALDALAGAAKTRNPTFAEVARDRIRVDGQPAVVLRGRQDVAGQPRTVRSTHVYAFGAELVVDALAPEADFRRVDELVFRPLVRRLELRAPK